MPWLDLYNTCVRVGVETVHLVDILPPPGPAPLADQVGHQVPPGLAVVERYPAFSLVQLLQYCALIGRELQSGEIFSCTERSYYML